MVEREVEDITHLKKSGSPARKSNLEKDEIEMTTLKIDLKSYFELFPLDVWKFTFNLEGLIVVVTA